MVKFTPVPKSEPKPKKEKKKPTLKKKACKCCGCQFQPERSLQEVCGYNCAIGLVRIRNQKKEEKDARKALKDGREKLKTLGQYEAEARKVFQKWIRMRDIADPCISCGRFAERYDGGHYFKAELYSGLIFNEENVHKQCSRPCNKDLHGNEANYRIGLVKKIGEERVKALEDSKDSLRTYKYTREELIEIKRKYTELLKAI